MSQNTIDKESKTYKFVAGKGIMNLPNQLTILRMIMIPVFVLFFYLQFPSHYVVACAIFALASITDFLDGYLARKYNLVTNLGKFLDPIADKVLVAAAFIVLLTKPEFFVFGVLGDWALIVASCGVVVILGRELIISGFRTVAASAGLILAADKIGKYKTFTQDLSIVILLIGMGINEFVSSIAVDIVMYVGLAMFAIAIVLTIISGIHYLVKNKQVLKA